MRRFWKNFRHWSNPKQKIFRSPTPEDSASRLSRQKGFQPVSKTTIGKQQNHRL
jgi:hypothetical protein